jgi:hypothetical protein
VQRLVDEFHVGGPLAQRREHLRERELAQLDAHLRASHAERRQQRRKEGFGHRAERRNGKRGVLSPRCRTHPAQRTLCSGEQRSRLAQQQLSRLRQLNLPGRAVEQRATDLLLQAFDLRRDCRLGEVQPHSRT